MKLLTGDEAVSRFVADESVKPFISQATWKRAAGRAARKEPGDKGLTLNQIAEDEATRAPLNTRARKRAALLRRRRAMKRTRTLQARRLILQRRITPAPSRGAARTATRLLAEHGAVTYTEERAA